MAFISLPIPAIRQSPTKTTSFCPHCSLYRISHVSQNNSLPLPHKYTSTIRCVVTSGDSSTKQVPFEIRGFSLANVGLLLGTLITAYSFYGYFSSYGTASGTSLGFVYGVPILLIGFALKYAELKPIPLKSTKETQQLRETKSTETLKKIVKDITRHRYGDEAHLSVAMRSLGMAPKGLAVPELVDASESIEEDRYVLALTFVSVETPWKVWEEKKEKFERFFGPNVKAEVKKLDADKRLVELRLIAV